MSTEIFYFLLIHRVYFAGSINALTVENPRYFKPYKRSMQKLSERLFGWSLKSWSYFLIPYKEAFGVLFPSEFTILISFKPDRESEVRSLLSLLP